MMRMRSFTNKRASHTPGGHPFGSTAPTGRKDATRPIF